MKTCLFDLQFRHFLLVDASSSRIASLVELAHHRQTLAGCGPRDQVYNRLVTRQWLATPIDTDEREQAVFNLVPLARSRRKMANRNGKTQFVRKALQLPFPQAEPGAIRASAVGRYQQPLRRRIRLLPFQLPPAADGGDGKRGGVMICPKVDETLVPGYVIDAIRMGTADAGTGKIMALDFLGAILKVPFATLVFVLSHQFLLLGVHLDDRVTGCHEPLDGLIDVAELRITVGMVLAFQCLFVGLQTIPQTMQDVGYDSAADIVAQLPKSLRKPPQTL